MPRGATPLGTVATKYYPHFATAGGKAQSPPCGSEWSGVVELREPLSNTRSEEHTSELQSQSNLVCRLLLEKKNQHYFGGFYRTGGQVLYVSTGIGQSVPIRVGVP